VQNVLLIQPQQTRIVGVPTISLVMATSVIVVVTIHVVDVRIEIVPKTILVC